jgi:hypothetical protein
VKIEEDEHVKKTSKYRGVSYFYSNSKWRAQRCSKHIKNKTLYNGYYDDEETAAHASDTLARKLMENGEQNHMLNFPEDYTEVHGENNKTTTSKYIGVSFYENKKSGTPEDGAKMKTNLFPMDLTTMKKQRLMLVILWQEN